MAVPASVTRLVDIFHRNLHEYRAASYNETQTRRQFIDPLFKALGWDVENEQGVSEIYREVVHEDSLRIEQTIKAPDYSFRLGGARKFFVEAKKPSVDLQYDRHPAFQLRRYGWSANLPISVLTDFEEFAIYDCRVRPDKGDKPPTARFFYFQYTDFLEQWSTIEALVSREAVHAGALDQFADEAKRRKGIATVDAAFLKEIEHWRELLAHNMAVWNKELSSRELNFAVQMTIDRIIFLRICEDRGIEPYGRLRELLAGGYTYERLCDIFRDADDRYNSGLFHFHDERDHSEPPDDLTLSLTVDGEPIKHIIRHLYYPDSPYAFSVIPIEILGHVYEQFLGRVIHVHPSTNVFGERHVTVEEKPEVRKAGGVYYTPTYIVDYIVKHTVGPLLAGKTPRQVAKLRVLDPACGSGSFLIGAYQYLLDWHLSWYEANGRGKFPKQVFVGAGGQPRLTTGERKRILLANIYGVDIDAQAVETTKLSLLLKVLEGETAESVGGQGRLFHERVLPNLSNNIKCGNSLVGSEFYDNHQMTLLDDDTRYRINLFDWEAAFPEVMLAGGFDAAISNPPYIRIQTMKEWAPLEVEFFKQRYSSASKGNYDIYVVFVEAALQLVHERGRVGFILPHKFFNAQYGQALRAHLAAGRYMAEIVHFGDQQIFPGASTYTCLLLLDKSGVDHCRVLSADNLQAWRATGKANESILPAEHFTGSPWNVTVGQGAALLDRLKHLPQTLETVTSRIFQGLKTGSDKVYIVEEIERTEALVKVYSLAKGATYVVEPGLFHPLVKGGDSKRYCLSRTSRLILFPYMRQGDGSTRLIPTAQMEAEFPLTWAYLKDNQSHLDSREGGKMHGEEWFGYTRNQALDVISLPKIFTPDIASRSSFSLDHVGDVFFTGGTAGGYGVLVEPEYSRAYLLGLLNSKLLEWVIHHTAAPMRGGYFSYESRFIRGLPVCIVPQSGPAHMRMVTLVERMLALHGDLGAARTSHERTQLQHQIDATDRQIDRLVYELYELSPDEVMLVEESTQAQRVQEPAGEQLGFEVE